MNSLIEETIARKIVRVVCGSESGTAFFIAPNLLLTALHVVSEAIVFNKPVEIYFQDNVILGTVTQIASRGVKVDVAIVEIHSGVNTGFLTLLSATLNKHQRLQTIGYPLELAECTHPFKIELQYYQTVGKSIPLELLVKTSNVSFFSYSGYSGAPLLNSSGSVVGILVIQENLNLKAISVKTLEPYLVSKSILVKANNLFEDDGPAGLMRCRENLNRAIGKAGSKYTPDVHQTNVQLVEELEKFTDGEAEFEYKKELDHALIWCKSHPRVLKQSFTIGNNYEKAIFRYLNDLESEYYNLRRDGKLPPKFKKEYAGINIKERLEHLVRRKYDANVRIFGIFGVAGCGKSHTSLWFSEKALNSGNHTYHCLGTDFTVEEPVDVQLKSILKLTDDDLKEIDLHAANRHKKVIFVFDAINEGAGYSYWKDNLQPFLSFLKKYDHFKLIITGRQANEGIDYILYEMRETDFVRSFELEGFSENEVEEAKEKYAKKYEFPVSRFNNLSVDFSNPLILKTFCKGQAARFRMGAPNISKLSIYADYLTSRNSKVSKLTDVDPKREITLEAVRRLASYSVFHAGFDNIKRKDAYRICNRLVNRPDWSKNLLNHLITENVLSEHFEYLSYDEQRIDFEFQNIGDTFRAKALFDSKMDIDSLLKFIIDNYNRKKGNRENILHTFVALLGIWDTALRPELTIDTIKSFNKSLLLEVLRERGQLNPIIEQAWLEKIDSFTIRELLINIRFLSTTFIDNFHENIKANSLVNRDEKNIKEINRIYEIHRREFYSYINATKITDSDFAYKYCLYCCWLGSTSHPDFRAVLKREVTKVISLCPEICEKLLTNFIQVNDPYIEELILCSVYGVLLILRDSGLSKRIAEIINQRYYKEGGTFPRNLLVRQWSELIVEYAKFYNSNLAIDINQGRHGTSNPLEWDYDNVNEDTIFGDTKGGKYLRSRLFTNGIPGIPSDFNRYIIGTNSRRYDIYLLKQNFDQIALEDIIHMIALEIINLGWKDSIGEIDNQEAPFDRFGNEMEKISKKYLWIAYYNVMALLSDHCKFDLGEYLWNREIPPIDNPPAWMFREASKFDPTLLISSFPQDKCIRLTFSPDLYQLEALLQSPEHFPSPILVREVSGVKWLLTDGWDGKSINIDDYQKMGNIHYQYISWIAKQVDFKALIGNIKGMNYHDMPNVSENRFEHLWNEYPWAKKSKYGHYEWTEIGIGHTLAMPTSIIQLQEDMAGIDYENQPMSSAYCPNWEMMQELGLYTAERGIIRSIEDKSIVAFNRNCTEISCGGLIIRQDALDKYLSKVKGYLLMRIEFYKSASEPIKFSRREYEWYLYSPEEGFQVIVPRYSTE